MSVYARSLRAALPAIAIAVVAYVCFLNKAFNLDDVVFLLMSKHQLTDPLHPASVFVSLNGHPPDWISNGMWSGPVMPTLLMPSLAAGGAEWLAHLAQLLVFVLGIVSSAALAIRLGLTAASARWVSLLVTTSPAVLAMASTAFPDIPTMAFGAWGIERLVAYRDERGWWRAVSATGGLALCVLSRQHGCLLVACMVPVMLGRWPSGLAEWRSGVLDRRFLSTIACMFAAAAIVVGVYFIMRDDHAGVGLAKTPIRVADSSLWRVNLANIPVQWMVTFPLGLAWIAMYRWRLLVRVWFWAAAALGVYLAFQTHVFTRRPVWLPWQAPLTAIGAGVLADVVVSAFRRRNMVELGLVGSLFIVLPMAVYTHLPPKYFLPAAPMMAILIMRHVEDGGLKSRRPLAVLCAVGAILGVLIIKADAVHGDVGREGGRVAAKYVAQDRRVWFDGAWAFQWYAIQAGAEPAHSGEDWKPAKGDILVVGLEGYIFKKVKNKTLLETIEFKAPGGRVLEKPAGFFSNVFWGPLPWKWSKKPHDPVDVYRID
jgi:hypothetical protein